MPTSSVNYELSFPTNKLIKLAEAFNAFYEEDTTVIPLNPQELTIDQTAMLIDMYTDWLERDFDDCLDDMCDNDMFKPKVG